MNLVDNKAKVIMVNGPVVKGSGMSDFKMREMVMVGQNKLIGEVISLEGDIGTVQVYEETEGLSLNEEIESTHKPLSLKLGPGLLSNMFDGIERPLKKLFELSGDYIAEGIGLISIDDEKDWDVNILVEEGDYVDEGYPVAWIQETEMIKHKVMMPPGKSGHVKSVVNDGVYRLEDIICTLEDEYGDDIEIKLYQEWPVRDQRPIQERKVLSIPLLTGQRVLDIFFPIAKGGTAAIPGGFGTGKTMTQHQLAKWCDADIIVYIGCGERGNEMTDVLHEFPKLIDPMSGKSIMERTVLIANTSNMPVAAREASIYTGITIAEFYRDMGYHVAIMADSTSRWAEALRELSGRLEEMPAEEGYPAYLPSRLAGFYERAGLVETLCGQEASVTIIGAVSPAGGDFSEPVTENTKRFVNAFLALDKRLAYARHYPAINWLDSYSGYLKMLENWYSDNVSDNILELRAEMLRVLHEEDKLKDIVQLVGEDVLPDDQRLILEIAKVIKVGFLQQNAFHKEDTYVPLQKQHLMLEIINYLFEKGQMAIKMGIPISVVKDPELYNRVTRVKYTIKNDNLQDFGFLMQDIDKFYNNLMAKYKN